MLGRIASRKDPDGIARWARDAANAKGALESRCHDTPRADDCGTLPDFKETHTYNTGALDHFHRDQFVEVLLVGPANPMNAAELDTALLTIAPGRHPEFRAIAARLRDCGLWEPLCRHAFWRIGAPHGSASGPAGRAPSMEDFVVPAASG